MRYIYYYYFILKGMSLNWLEISLVYELPNYRCIASRTTYLSVWRLLILINSLQEGDVKFIWSVCGPNELELKRCICTPIGWKCVFTPIQACDISIYIYIWIDALYLCVRNNITEQKHLERKKEYHPRGRWSSSSMMGVWTSGLRTRIWRSRGI
jgi:hypothetical protein